MTVTAGDTPYHSYFPGSAMAAEAIPFEFMALADLQVQVVGGGALTEGVDYQLAGDPRARTATITALVDADSDEWEMWSETAAAQNLDLAESRTIPLPQYETELDRSAIRARENSFEIARAPKFARGATVLEFGDFDDAEGKTLAVVGGKVVPITNSVSGAEASALVAVQAALDAEGYKEGTAADLLATTSLRALTLQDRLLAEAAAAIVQDIGNAKFSSTLAGLPTADGTQGWAIIPYGADEGLYEDTGSWTRRGSTQAVLAQNAADAAAASAEALAAVRLNEGFTDIDGWYRSDSGLKMAGSYTIDADGRATVDIAPNKMLWAYPAEPVFRPKGAGVEYWVEAKVANSYGTAGACIVIGEGADMRVYTYRANGSMEIYNGSGTTVQAGKTPGWRGGDGGATRYAANQSVKLGVVCFPDNTGYMVGIHPTGQHFRVPIIAPIPDDCAVGIGWPPTTQLGSVGHLKAIPLRGDWKADYERDVREGKFGPVIKDTINLPDLPGGSEIGGATYTGAAEITRGPWTSCLAMGCDGRKEDTFTNTFPEGQLKPQIVITTPDGRKPIQVLDLGINATLQGTTTDTRGSVDTLWVAVSNADEGIGQLRHYHLEHASYTKFGVSETVATLDPETNEITLTEVPVFNAAVEIVEDRIDYLALYGKLPNGVAFNRNNESLFITQVSDNVAREMACDPAASPRELSTLTLSDTQIDQADYDPDLDVLYYTRGPNGEDGDIYQHDVATNVSKRFWMNLPNAQAIEAVLVRKDRQEIWVWIDGNFHTAANPRLGAILIFAADIA